MSEVFDNIYLPCVEPLLDTWAVTKQGGEWDISPSVDLSNTSARERNTWCAEAMMSTIEAFSCLTRVFRISFGPIPTLDKKTKVKGKSFSWDFNEPYHNFLETAYQSLKDYPVDIYILYIGVDLFVYVRTKESPNKPVRAWIRECGDYSYEMADLQISLEHMMNNEPFLYFGMHHTLFYPDSWKGHDDNTELFELNRPFLEEALKNWEQKFNASIEIEGLPQIYKYGFLPYS
ncbi:MAG: hypothetical protein AAF383_01290 [Cyanobacteria bacterium P01_A01_bin.83]